MRGSLVIIAVLCVVVSAAEASNVMFVSVDEEQTNGNNKSDSDVKKSINDVVKKINDGISEGDGKTVKNAELVKSAGNGSESAREAAKESAAPGKGKIQKRDVRRALDLLAKSAMKRASAEDADSGWNIFNARKILYKYLTVQKKVISKITTSLIYTIEHAERDEKEKENLLKILNQFQTDMEQVYDSAIKNLESPNVRHDVVSKHRKFMRADELPSVMTALNQRNPLALIPMLGRVVGTISGAANAFDIASSLTSRSSAEDLEAISELFGKLVSNTMQLPAEIELSEY